MKENYFRQKSFCFLLISLFRAVQNKQTKNGEKTMPRLFGTDGARGVANSELTCELAMKIGRAAAVVLAGAGKSRPKILIGQDPRISSQMLEAALTAGICSVGADVLRIGTVPTPAVAYLVKKYEADAGVMISASHNSCEYNGIKLFSGTGFKLSDELEDKIEELVKSGVYDGAHPTGENVGRVIEIQNAVEDYINHVVSTVDVRFDGMKVALDCANGSSSVCAEQLYKRLGAEVSVIHNHPDGININDKCGSTHMESLKAFVKANEMDIGLAFDGDADRCLAVDSDGNLVDGDVLIAIAALDMKKRGKLKNDTAVVTVMTNMGFWKFAEQNGINVKKTAVGDRYVLEEMLKNDYVIGGEQSGHIIFREFATTGDGELTGVQLLAAMKREGKTLRRLAGIMKIYPQTLKNVVVTPEGKAAYGEDCEIKSVIESVENELSSDGRVLVRLSGTEPKIRVMLEGTNLSDIERLADKIVDKIKERLL